MVRLLLPDFLQMLDSDVSSPAADALVTARSIEGPSESAMTRL